MTLIPTESAHPDAPDEFSATRLNDRPLKKAAPESGATAHDGTVDLTAPLCRQPLNTERCR